MKRVINLFVLGVLILSTSSCFTRVQTGHVGVKVNLSGNDKGVSQTTLVAGWVFYSPMSTSIYEFPTFMQHKVWTHDTSEDNPKDEELTITAKGGADFKMDVGLNYTIEADKVPYIFSKYKRDINEITDQFIRNTVRQSFNDLAGTYSVDSLLDNRTAFEKQVEKNLKTKLQPEGFIIDNLTIIGSLRPVSKDLANAINFKNKAKQDAISQEITKQKTMALADQKRVAAQGDADATLIKARAEAEANRLRQVTLTPMLIQQNFVDQWDGKLPVYGSVPQLFKDISSK